MRVKAEAEDELMRRFDAVCWRPGIIDGAVPDRGAWFHGRLRPLVGLFRAFRGLYIRGDERGAAMLRATREGLRGRVLSHRDMRDLADRATRG